MRPGSLAGIWALARPFPAHLRENRDLCAGSTGTKCLQIKIVFPSALLACFMLALHQAALQTSENISPAFTGTLVFITKFTHFPLLILFSVVVLYSVGFPYVVKRPLQDFLERRGEY